MDVSHNQLQRLPESLPQNLEELNVLDNQLQRLPDHLPQNLLTLKTSSNRLRALPDNLPPNLRMLDVTHNQLQSLPNYLPINLETLRAESNQLQRLPDNLPRNLQDLDVSENQLQALPEDLPPNLRILIGSRNQLQRLPEALPQNLSKLDVSGNQLRTLPNNLPRALQTLIVNNNQLQTLPNNLPQNLKALYANSNHLRTLPDHLPQSLQSLQVCGNQLQEVDVNLFRQPPRANHFRLDRNPLSPQSVEDLRVLQSRPDYIGPRIVFEPTSAVEIPAPQPDDGQAIDLILERAERLGLLNPLGPAQLPDEAELMSILNDLMNINTFELTNMELGSRILVFLEVLLNVAIQLERPAQPRPPVRFGEEPVLNMEDFMHRFQAIIDRLPELEPQEEQQPQEPIELGEAIANWVTPSTPTNIAATSRLWRSFADEPGAASFAQFLLRLGQTVNSTDPQFRASVAEWLTHLETRSELRQATFDFSEEATASCEDRVSLSFNAMRELRLSFDVARGDYDNRLPELIDLARGMFRLDELARIAAETTQTLQRTLAPTGEAVLEIEVYLAYQTRLRESLALPIGTRNMRYFNLSNITQTDLDEAVQRVRQAEQNNFANYLSSEWQPWQRVLQRLAPEMYERARNELVQAMSDEFTRRMNNQLQRMALLNETDAERAVGAQVRAEIEQEVYGQLTRDFLASKRMLNLLG
jgi:Leucine-rich repeat (LRR) protein